MARFYASIQGHRGEATRMGHQDITGHIRGWRLGARVDMKRADDSRDRCTVTLTGGSGGRANLPYVQLTAEDTADNGLSVTIEAGAHNRIEVGADGSVTVNGVRFDALGSRVA